MKQSTQARRLEREARKLLAKVGRFSETHDSARLMFALGHLSQAVTDLQQMAAVLEGQERQAQEEAR